MSAIVRFLAVSPRLTVEPPILDKRELINQSPFNLWGKLRLRQVRGGDQRRLV